MGRGAGCFPSTSKKNPDPAAAAAALGSPPLSPKAAAQIDNPAEAQAAASAGNRDAVALRHDASSSRAAKVYVIFYSMYGHVEALARKVKEGVDSVDGAEGVLFRVPETLPQEVLDKMHAPPKDESIPTISAAQLPAADAFLFGFPTRYGAMSAQMKAFFDSTGNLWRSQQLAGKAAGFFVSTGTQGGGQETTAWTAITQLVHHGMLYIPVGYTFGAGMFRLDELRGGSPYGAGTFAGDGSRMPTEVELQLAEHQGKYTAGIVRRLVVTK